MEGKLKGEKKGRSRDEREGGKEGSCFRFLGKGTMAALLYILLIFLLLSLFYLTVVSKPFAPYGSLTNYFLFFASSSCLQFSLFSHLLLSTILE